MEGITKKQKKYLLKWMVIMGIICGAITGIVLHMNGSGNWNESDFWLCTIVLGLGGGYFLGFLPAILLEYRKKTME